MKVSDIIAVGTLGAALVCVESIREQWNFKVTRYSIQTPKMESGAEPKRIIFLSDLHNHEYGKKNIRLLKAISNEKPDLILIGGDMLVGKPGQIPQQAWSFVRQLPRIAPVYYANGNHEQRMKEQPEKYGNVFSVYRQELKEAGVHFLENESIIKTLDGISLRISGLELPMETYQKFQRFPVTEEEIHEQVGTIDDEDVYQILLAHNPAYYDAYKKWGADLVLSGHLHGGIARIPGWRGVITPQAFLFPKYSGEMTEADGQTIVVSRGLGMHTIKFRLFNVPEMIVLEISEESSDNVVN